MKNNRKCPDCGTINKGESDICENCGKKMIQDDIELDEEDIVQDELNIDEMKNRQTNSSEDPVGSILAIISLVLFFSLLITIPYMVHHLPNGFSDEFIAIATFCPIIGIIVSMFSRRSFPTNKMVKLASWIIWVSIIVFFIALVVILCILVPNLHNQ